MMKWIKQLLENPEKIEEINQQSATMVDSTEEVAAGLNFKTAIDAHVMWKLKLSRYLENRSDEILTEQHVCSDSNCTLGKWIYSTGSEKYGDLSLFSELKEEHKAFHNHACEIVKVAHAEDKTKAIDLLNSRKYSRASMRVVQLLGKLYQEVKKNKPN